MTFELFKKKKYMYYYWTKVSVDFKTLMKFIQSFAPRHKIFLRPLRLCSYVPFSISNKMISNACLTMCLQEIWMRKIFWNVTDFFHNLIIIILQYFLLFVHWNIVLLCKLLRSSTMFIPYLNVNVTQLIVIHLLILFNYYTLL